MQKLKVGTQVIYPELSYQILSVCFDIHNAIGPGFTENIYEVAFSYELARRKMAFEQQKSIEIPYKGIILGNYRLDFVIDQKIIVELKAVGVLDGIFRQQVVSYLKATGLKLGLLINFGSRRLEHVRVINPILPQ